MSGVLTPDEMRRVAENFCEQYQPGLVLALLVAGSGLRLEVPGWDAAEILHAAEAGEVGFLYLVGHDPGGTVGARSAGSVAQNGSTFMVVQDPFMTPAARAADVVLPVALLLERTGHFTAADGRPRQLRRAVPPPADLPQDGQIFTEIARRCGKGYVWPCYGYLR